MAIDTTAQRNNVATGYGEPALYASLHDASPGSTGANEISGGSPAYARKQVAWSGASNGQITGTVIFDVPAGRSVSYGGLWTQVSGGTFLDGEALSAVRSFVAQGQLQITVTYTQS